MAGGQAQNFGMTPVAAVNPLAPNAHMPQQNDQGTSSPVTGQFLCPTHGSVGLPQYTHTGAPVCPLGGQLMQFNGVGASPYALAAGG